MEDTMEEENGREAKLKAEITRWLIFFGVAIMLSVMTWLGQIMADFRRRTDLHVHAQQQHDLRQRP